MSSISGLSGVGLADDGGNMLPRQHLKVEPSLKLAKIFVMI